MKKGLVWKWQWTLKMKTSLIDTPSQSFSNGHCHCWLEKSLVFRQWPSYNLHCTIVLRLWINAILHCWLQVSLFLLSTHLPACVHGAELRGKACFWSAQWQPHLGPIHIRLQPRPTEAQDRNRICATNPLNCYDTHWTRLCFRLLYFMDIVKFQID